MSKQGSGVLLTGQLVGGADSNEHSVYLFEGEAHSFWLAGSATAGAGYLANPKLTLSGDPNDPDTAGTPPVVAQGNAEGTNAVISFVAPASGWYLITVADGSGAGPGGRYELVDSNRSFEADILDHIGPGTAGIDLVLAVGDTLESQIWRQDDTDVVAVTLNAGTAYRIDMRGVDSGNGTLSDPLLALLDSDGNVLLQADNGGIGHNSRIDFTPASTGTYFLRAATAIPFDSGTYELQVSDSGASTDNVPAAITTPFSVPIWNQNSASTNSVRGTIDAAGDTDWYAVRLVEGFAYRFDLSSSGLADPFLELRDSTGVLVTSNDDAPGGTNAAQLTFTPGESGLFYLVARDADAGTGGFELSAVMTDQVPLSTIIVGADSAASHGVTINGSETDDDLYGSNLGDEIYGGGGYDWIEGGAGNDTLSGGSDYNHLDGGAGIDTYDGGRYVNLANTGYQYVGGLTWEQIVNVENVIGTSDPDVLVGNAAANALSGGAGYDLLTGAGGRDLLTGGGGLDRMIYKSISESGTAFASRDVINTFAHGDKIDLSAIDANSRVAGNQAFTFVTNFTRVAGQLQWDQTAPAGWLVTGDVNGDGAADFSLQIYASTAFGHPYAWDFIL
jgi:Ca2+-binding RTX toxin-like protein